MNSALAAQMLNHVVDAITFLFFVACGVLVIAGPLAVLAGLLHCIEHKNVPALAFFVSLLLIVAALYVRLAWIIFFP